MMPELIPALAEAINASAGVPLAHVKYLRELAVIIDMNGIVAVRCAKRGYDYKRHGSRPKSPPDIDSDSIAAALNKALMPLGYTVFSVEDAGEAVIIFMEVEQCQK